MSDASGSSVDEEEFEIIWGRGHSTGSQAVQYTLFPHQANTHKDSFSLQQTFAKVVKIGAKI